MIALIRKINHRALLVNILRILIVALLSFVLDYVIVDLSQDDSIWLGASIEVAGSVIFGPAVGGAAAALNILVSDLLMYGSYEFAYLAVVEIAAVVLIGAVYRKLVKDDNRFGVKEIVIFNFIQVLIAVCLIFLATTPLAITLFGSLTEDWTVERFSREIVNLGGYTFSACVSVGLIGTVLIATCTYFRREYRKTGSAAGAIRSLLRPTFIRKEYRRRGLEYSIGFVFAVALTMIDGVVSGHVLGQDALAATSIMFPLISFSGFLSGIVTNGCSNLCALAKGERDYERSNRLFTLGLMSTIALGLLQTLLFLLIRDRYFAFYTATEAIESCAREYYNVFLYVPLFMGLAAFLDNIVSSDGDDMLGYAGYVGSFAVNVVLSILLSRTMGMGGLALGTLLSYVFYLLVVSIHFFKRSNTFRLRPWFSIRDLLRFAEFSLKNNTAGLCLAVASAAFTKAILQFLGSDWLVANTVLCAIMEVYEMINGPSEAAEFLLGTYTGEKNREGMKTLFMEALWLCLLGGLVVGVVLILHPSVVLSIYGVENSPYEAELIKCIRFSSIGIIAAAVGGFLSDYYGNTGKPLWSCLLVIFRTALFPVLFCVTFCLEGGIVSMGIGLMLSQILAIAVFYGFVLVQKGSEMIPYMIDDPDCEKVYMNSFDYNEEEYGRICGWMRDQLTVHGTDAAMTAEAETVFRAICKKTEENNRGKAVCGECVLRFIDEPEIIIKDNGALFDPDMKDERVRYHVLLACNSCTIHLGRKLMTA